MTIQPALASIATRECFSSAARYHSMSGSDVRDVKPTGSQQVPSAAFPNGAVAPTPLRHAGVLPNALAPATQRATMTARMILDLLSREGDKDRGAAGFRKLRLRLTLVS